MKRKAPQRNPSRLYRIVKPLAEISIRPNPATNRCVGPEFFVMSESDCGFKQSLRYMNLSGAKFYKLGRNNHHDEIDEHEKLILRNTIIACCPNVVHVVIDDELVSQFYFDHNIL